MLIQRFGSLQRVRDASLEELASLPDQGVTWASLSIQAGGAQIRRAAATWP
jgi:DNA repair protein RadC